MIAAIWTRDRFAWDSELIRVPEREIVPRPLQRPHPPLWQTVTGPESCEIAGRLGVGMLGSANFSPLALTKGAIEAYERGLAECRPAGAFVNDARAIFTIVHCRETREEVVASGAAEAALWFMNEAPNVFRVRRENWVGLIRGIQGGAIGLHVGGRHARRRHDDHVERQVAAAFGHEANARDACHIGNFMGIGDDGGHAAGKHGRGKLGRRAEAAFDVHVRVDKAGRHVAFAQVNGPRGVIAVPDAHDAAGRHGDVGFFDCAGKDVDDAPVAQQQIRLMIAACNREQGRELHTVLPGLNRFRPL